MTSIRYHKHLQIFAPSFSSCKPCWHLNRRSVAGAFANGLFFAFVPVPFQMVLAAGGAIVFKVNLPLSVALVWVSNPITMPPLFYGAYLVGAWVLGIETGDFNFDLSWEWLTSGLVAIWQPFLLGCLITGVASAVVGYMSIRLIWRYRIVKEWRKRKLRRTKE